MQQGPGITRLYRQGLADFAERFIEPPGLGEDVGECDMHPDRARVELLCAAIIFKRSFHTPHAELRQAA